MSKVIGITVGTPISKEKIKEISGEVKTVNGVKPDDNGDVKITIPEQVTIDNSLSVEGAAADSKAVGDKFKEFSTMAENLVGVKIPELEQSIDNNAIDIIGLKESVEKLNENYIKGIVDDVISEALEGDY